VIEFDQQGNMVQTWGPQGKQDWPSQAPRSLDAAYGTLNSGERGLFVDAKDNVWIGSDHASDTFAIKLSKYGKPYLTLGKKGAKSGGSNDTDTLNGASGLAVEPEKNEVYVADGARNRRVIVFDAYSGTYLRHWGAYGKPPDDSVAMKPDAPNTDAPQFGDVSAVAISRDKQVYVGDRANNRVQVFKTDGTFIRQGVIAPKTLAGTVFGIAFSADPDQRFVYVADGSNEKIWMLDRASMEVLGSFGSGGHNAGQFTTVYAIATDSKGNIYTGETWEGKRVQRFLYKGLVPAGR
jgi:DNA-binding beta-propeller fold protein YncE